MYFTNVVVVVAALFPLVFSVPLPTTESEIADATAIPIIADTSPPVYPFVDDMVMNRNPPVPNVNSPIDNILMPRNPNELVNLFVPEESSSLAPMYINRNQQGGSTLPPLESIVPQVSEAPGVTSNPQPRSSHPPIPAHSIAGYKPVTSVYTNFPGLNNNKETETITSSSGPVTTPEVELPATHTTAQLMADSLQMKISEHVLDMRDEYIKVAQRLDEDHNNKNGQVYNSMFDHLGSAMDDMSQRLKDEGLMMNEDK